MSYRTIAQSFESFLADESALETLIAADPNDMPFLLLGYIGQVHRQARILEHQAVQDETGDLDHAIAELKDVVQEATPKATRLVGLYTLQARQQTLEQVSGDAGDIRGCGSSIIDRGRVAIEKLREARTYREVEKAIGDFGRSVKADLKDCWDKVNLRPGREP